MKNAITMLRAGTSLPLSSQPSSGGVTPRLARLPHCHAAAPGATEASRSEWAPNQRQVMKPPSEKPIMWRRSSSAWKASITCIRMFITRVSSAGCIGASATNER